MEKEKLLRVLICKLLAAFIIAGEAEVLACGSQVCNAENYLSGLPGDWIMDKTDEALEVIQKEVLANFKKLQQERGRMEDFSRIVNPQANLRIFVSSSMKLETLKSYYRTSAKYGGIMVFKGLPEGSFKELYRFVGQITGSDGSNEEAAMQIDDEVFTRFGINHVPAIVLSKESDCMFKQSCKITFDKVEGNIGIRRALEEFAASGDLKKEAAELLTAGK